MDLPTPAPTPERGAGRPGLRTWALLTAAGLVGVASIAPYAADLLASLPADALPLPLAAALALSLLQSAAITALLTALGVFAAPRVSFVSRVQRAVRGEVQRPWRPEARAALLGAGIVAAALVLGELAFLALLGDELRALWAAVPRTLEVTLQGFLYGGITEELLMRFGLLSGLVWLLWRGIGRRRGPPSRTLVAAVVVGVALLFALAHLPATAALVDLDARWVARSLLLNGVAALVFGWLFVRHSLEAAMAAHAGAHALVTLVALGTPLF